MHCALLSWPTPRRCVVSWCIQQAHLLFPSLPVIALHTHMHSVCVCMCIHADRRTAKKHCCLPDCRHPAAPTALLLPWCSTSGPSFSIPPIPAHNTHNTQARDINLDIKRVVSYRHWCNKLWNAIRFALLYLPPGFSPLNTEDIAAALPSWPTAARWILSRLNVAVEATNKVRPACVHSGVCG